MKMWTIRGLLGGLVLSLVACTSGMITTGTDDDPDANTPDGASCGLTECPPGTVCVAGRCVAADPCDDVVCSNPGEVCSGGHCVSGDADEDHDGSPARADCDDFDPTVYPGVTRPCSNDCGEGYETCGDDARWSDCTFEEDPCVVDHAEASCVEGQCVIESCDTGWLDCDTLVDTGCEAELGTRTSCSGCGDTCAASEQCQSGVCRCVPDCTGAACGDGDGCGGTCSGTCPPAYECRSGRCVCDPSCAGVACGGSDGCGGTCMTGHCPTGFECRAGTCVCVPDCSGASCGDSDGCGGSCSGWCPTNETCTGGGCACLSPYRIGPTGLCVNSCGGLLHDLGLFDNGSGCCPYGCVLTTAATYGGTWDLCNFCCESNPSGPSCL